MRRCCAPTLAKTFLALALIVSVDGTSQDRVVISKESLAEMFESIARDSSWDLSKPMLWGYFFTDASRERLERAAPLLVAKGYRLVDIHLGDKEEPSEADVWWLHVERVEVHTVDTLNDRNKVLYQFADDQGIDSYDGMDVGPADRLN